MCEFVGLRIDYLVFGDQIEVFEVVMEWVEKKSQRNCFFILLILDCICMEMSVCEITELYGCVEVYVFFWFVDRGVVEGCGFIWRWSGWVDVVIQGGGLVCGIWVCVSVDDLDIFIRWFFFIEGNVCKYLFLKLLFFFKFCCIFG